MVLLQAVKLLVQIMVGSMWRFFFNGCRSFFNKFVLLQNETIGFAKENILFLSFAPHSTHKMQALDIAVHGPLKFFQNVESRFRSSGMWSYNPHTFFDVDYIPASFPDHPDPENASDIRNSQSETTSLPAFVNVHPNGDSASNVHSGQSHTLCRPASLIIIPGPGYSTDIDSSKSCYNPHDILFPLVAYRAQADKCRCKRKCQPHKILTSTPVREYQREKLEISAKKR
ncbi:hypothetical protein PR048_005275 [Dryococelus australis]|uniref:DDE-1 domain-containing protein n=1 Tax=Dryococelus australis TaxID=614101 RepID=A0ABQ9I7T2_9NEOP|nr:hypothetical protein PR048_005275 [Dryococelus australis]